MASLHRSTCLLRGIRCIPQLSLKKICPSHRHMYCTVGKRNTRIFSPVTSWLCLYSTQNSSDIPKQVTDDILKAGFDKSGGNEGDQTGSEKKKKESKWTGKNMWKLGLIFLSGYTVISAGVLVWIWGAPSKDPEGEEVKDEYSDLPTVLGYFKRASREFHLYKQMIRDPSSEKLLPDPLEEPYYQPPYTLVLEMTGVLVHPDWTYGTGWRFKKRPGVDYFLQQIGPPLFEVVIYTSEQGFTAFPILDSLDPNGYIMYRLFRDATRYMNGHHVKDLSCLNRDLSKVIIVDWNEQSYRLQPRNALGVKRWSGNDEDRKLVDLALFLRTVGMSGVEDVRTVLDYYKQFDDPIAAFKENQQKLQEEQSKQSQKTTDAPTSSFLSSLTARKRL